MIRHHHRIAFAIAVTAALAAAAPASARFELNPAPTTAVSSPSASPNLCSEVCGAYARGTSAPVASAERGATLPHDPRPRGELSSAAVTQSSPTGPRSEVVSGGGYGNPVSALTVARVAAPTGGFHWGDAGIGAGGAFAIVLLLAGGLAAATTLRHRGDRTAAERPY